VTAASLLGDIRRLFSAERTLILALAGPFLFLPAYALQLLAPRLPPFPTERTEEALSAWADRLVAWGGDNAGWYLAADAVGVLGLGALAVLLADAARPTVGEALARAAALWPRMVLASVLAAVPVNLGLWLIVPGLFFQARLAATLPALAVEGRSATGAIVRSWRVTGRASWAAFAAAAALFAFWWLLLMPVAPVDAWLRTPGHGNPVVLAVVDAAMAALAALYRVGVLLLGVVAYRRLAS